MSLGRRLSSATLTRPHKTCVVQIDLWHSSQFNGPHISLSHRPFTRSSVRSGSIVWPAPVLYASVWFCSTEQPWLTTLYMGIVKPGKLGKIPIKGKIRSRLWMDRVGLEGRSGAICSYFTLFFGGKLHSIESNLQGKPRRYGLIFKIMWKFVHNGWMEWERGERGGGGFLVFGQRNINEEKKGPMNSYQVSEKWMGEWMLIGEG